MRISRAGAALVALLALGACDPAGVAGSGANRVTVMAAGQPVTIVAPAGFCVDKRSTTVSKTGAFVLVSDCGLLGLAAPTGKPPIGAAMTATVSTEGLGDGGPATQSLAALERYADTPRGRAMVGRSGQSAGVRILQSETKGDVLYLLVEDRGSKQPIAGIDKRFWRAFLEVNGRLIALSQIGFQDGGIDDQAGLTLVASFAAAIQAGNPAGAVAKPAGAPVTAAAPAKVGAAKPAATPAG